MWTVTFFNSGLVLLLINANYMRVPLPRNSPILRGPYKDFTIEWYWAVGSTIVITTIINSIMPISNLGYIIMTYATRCWDRGCSNDMRKTKKIIQAEYEKVYLGD